MLYAIAPPDGADLLVLSEIGAMREDLRLYMRQPRRWDRQLRRNLTARAIVGSNTIEGYTATVADVEDLMAGEEPLEASPVVAAEINGYQQAMTYIQRLADAGPDFAYGGGLLNALHWMMQGHHLRKRPGWWRTGGVYVTSVEDPAVPEYTAPEAGDVPPLMARLVDWLNEGDLDQPALVRAAFAHLNLVKVHPWTDGNGRMSRALHTLLLARDRELAPEFSSIEEWLGRPGNTLRYYDVLREVGGPVWSPERDTHPWLRFCLRAHHLQAQVVQRDVDATRTVWQTLEELTARQRLDERMVYALYPVAMGQRLRRSTYQSDAALNSQQAQRDLRALTMLGLVQPSGNTKGRIYLPGERLTEHLRDARPAPRPLRDPYAA